MWGTRAPFLLAAAMVVAVVMPIVFVLRLLKNAMQSLFVFITMYCKTNCYSRNANNMASAQTTLVQWNPGILGNAVKLLTSTRQLRHHTGAPM
jgi:hypothetical protein